MPHLFLGPFLNILVLYNMSIDLPLPSRLVAIFCLCCVRIYFWMFFSSLRGFRKILLAYFIYPRPFLDLEDFVPRTFVWATFLRIRSLTIFIRAIWLCSGSLIVFLHGQCGSFWGIISSFLFRTMYIHLRNLIVFFIQDDVHPSNESYRLFYLGQCTST